MQVQSLGQEDPLEKGMATHSSSLAWRPMDGGAWLAIVHGVPGVRHNLTDNPTSTRIQVCVCTMSCPTLYDPMTLHGSPCLPPGDHPNSGIKPTFLALAGRFFISSTTWEAPPPNT